MASTRSFKSPGVFAENASTTIPPTPIAGVAYRDAVTGADDTPNGWRYGTRVESQDWNQVMFMLTSMLAMQDKQGLLGWSDQVDYDVPAIVFGSNGLLYIALQASGPSTAPQDPTAGLPYWSDFAMHGMVALTTSQTWTVPMAMQLGYIRPKVTVVGGGGGGSKVTADVGNGGGGGGTSVDVINLFGVPSVSATVGIGGLGGAGSAPVAGAAGGSTIFDILSATGGAGASATLNAKSVGGVGSGGAININGGSGGGSRNGGDGGHSTLGAGGLGVGPTATGPGQGSNGYGPGAGGGGSVGGATTGNGAAGIIIIEW